MKPAVGVRSLSQVQQLSVLRCRFSVLFEGGFEDGVDGLVGGQVGGVDGEVGETSVEGMALLEAELGCGGVGEDRAGDVLQHAAVEEGGEGGVEEDGEGGRGLFEKEAVGELFRRAAAEGEDGVVLAEGRGEGGGFETAEVSFAVLGEEMGDRGSGAGLEVGVEVEELPVEAGGEEAADGGFACSHEAGEDEAAEMSGREGGGGLVGGHGFTVSLGFGLVEGLGLGFGFGGRHGLSLQVLRENERAATFLGCGSGRSMTLKVLGGFRDACEDSAGRWVAPIAEGKARK